MKVKKKVKDMTIAEAKRICNKYEDCTDRGGCPLHHLTCLDVMHLTLKDLEEEIEVEDDEQTEIER